MEQRRVLANDHTKKEWNHKKTQSKKKGRKEEQRNTEQMGQTENKQQDGGFKSNCIDNKIKCKWSKYSN